MIIIGWPKQNIVPQPKPNPVEDYYEVIELTDDDIEFVKEIDLAFDYAQVIPPPKGLGL